MNKLIFLLFSVLYGVIGLYAQDPSEAIRNVQLELERLKEEERALQEKLETYRLEKIRYDLKEVGLPSADYIEHTALFLEYSEEHEQARWVAHVIHPLIKEGRVRRTNDFRADPQVSSGSAEEADYFLKDLLPDSTYEYDGYGYDRGHLAPSADFRWSAKALSESYFYSNMSPQRPEFNQKRWAELENFLRGYVIENEVPLFVVTGPVLRPDLPKVKRSVNGLSLPDTYFKAILDLENQRSIGFIMENKGLQEPIETFAVSIDEVEAITGLDFFSKLPDSKEEALENTLVKEDWFSNLAKGEAEPLFAPNLPKNHFNTVNAKRYAGSGEAISVCGKVVSARISRSGNLWMNLDRRYPNQIFSVFIRKNDLANFSYNPEKELMDRVVCFKGKVNDMNGVPTMQIGKEKDLDFREGN